MEHKKDLEELTPSDCYERIYRWHKKEGIKKISEKDMISDSRKSAYRALLERLPSPTEASAADRDFVFKQVRTGQLMEWSSPERDEFGFQLYDYAGSAVDKQYPKGLADEKFEASAQSSRLFSEFKSR